MIPFKARRTKEGSTCNFGWQMAKPIVKQEECAHVRNLSLFQHVAAQKHCRTRIKLAPLAMLAGFGIVVSQILV